MAKGIKTGGREAGTPNKVTKELRACLKTLIEREINQIDELLNQLEPKERLAIIVKLLPYVLPKQNATNEQPESFDSVLRIVSYGSIPIDEADL